jgi:hypothetical protein
MRFLKVSLLVVCVSLLLTLLSCSSEEATSDDTKTFLSSLNLMMTDAYMSDASQALQSFRSSDPPGPSISFNKDIEEPTENLRKMRDPMGLDTLYGTWDYIDLQGWTHVDSNNPADAILFTWEYVDSADHEHDAELLIDSLEFYEAEEDTLPTKIWIGLNSDGDDLAWVKFTAHYTSAKIADEASFVYEIVNYYQIGASITSNVEIDTTVLDSMDFNGTVHLWAEDLRIHYKVDYYLTGDGENNWILELEDSDDWEMELNVYAPSEVVIVEDEELERREVEGEIRYNGEIAATIDGYVWNPEDSEHESDVIIVFNDDTEEDFRQYAGLLNLFMGSM